MLKLRKVSGTKRIENLVREKEIAPDSNFEKLLKVSGNDAFEALKADARQIKRESKDYVMHSDDIKFLCGNKMSSLALSTVHNDSVFNLTDHSFTQLNAKLGIPVRYMNRLVNEEYNDLACQNVNTMLGSYGKKLFVRTHNDRVRGILTPKYSVCDADEVLDVIDDKFDPDTFTLKGCYLSDERFHLRAAMKERITPDEDLFGGFSVDTSDVGRNILIVRFIIYKQVCSNGLIVPKQHADLFSQKHIGITSDEFAKGLERGLEMIPNFVDEFREKILIAREDVLTSDFMQKVRDDVLAKQTSLSENQINKVIYLTSEKYGLCRWGYINALTEVAQELTLENRIEVEQYAGRLLVA